MLAIGMPGIPELIILSLLLLVPLGIAVVVVGIVFWARRQSGANSSPRSCPKCEKLVSNSGHACEHCGSSLPS